MQHVLDAIQAGASGADIAALSIPDHYRAAFVRREDAASLSKQEVLGLIFVHGLSTKDVVSSLAGQGVGMDVVKTDIARVGGIIEVESERGIGTRFTITIPITPRTGGADRRSAWTQVARRRDTPRARAARIEGLPSAAPIACDCRRSSEAATGSPSASAATGR